MKSVFQKRPVKGFLFTIILPIAILRVYSSEVLHATAAAGQKNVSKDITIQTVLAEDTLSISPVPATRYSSIIWSSTSNSKLNITLLDVAGRTVLSRQYPLRTGVNELLLTNLEALPAGLYVVLAFDGAQHRNGKLIVNHTS